MLQNARKLVVRLQKSTIGAILLSGICHVILVFMPMLFEIISTMSFFIEHHSKSALKSLENIFSKMFTDVVGTLLQKTFSGVIIL